MKNNVLKSFVLFLGVMAVISTAGVVIKDSHLSEEAVKLVSEKTLVPGGQSVGIKMDVKGVLVVGLEEIETADSVVNPGFDAGLQIGDTILSINGKDVFYAYEVSEMLKSSDGNLKMSVMRGEETLFIDIKAAKDYKSGEYKLGIWVKEKIAGIGTLTFYDSDTNTFAALGHGIYERKTNVLVEAGNGELLKTEVNSIKEGEVGKPGEIRGIFYDEEVPLGKISKNSTKGIYATGLMVENLEMAEPMVMATKEQVKEGKAYILTTIDGTKVEKFDIEIVGVNRQDDLGSKGLEIKVTDTKLLSYCGGIVQGMSGSPIIQKDRIVGAVTHVLVNDPTRGYGIFIEEMLDN